jgi:hypothetical protein
MLRIRRLREVKETEQTACGAARGSLDDVDLGDVAVAQSGVSGGQAVLSVPHQRVSTIVSGSPSWQRTAQCRNSGPPFAPVNPRV